MLSQAGGCGNTSKPTAHCPAPTPGSAARSCTTHTHTPTHPQIHTHLTETPQHTSQLIDTHHTQTHMAYHTTHAAQRQHRHHTMETDTHHNIPRNIYTRDTGRYHNNTDPHDTTHTHPHKDTDITTHKSTPQHTIHIHSMQRQISQHTQMHATSWIHTHITPHHTTQTHHRDITA